MSSSYCLFGQVSFSLCMEVELDFLVSVKSLSSRPWTHWWPDRYAGRHRHTKCTLRDSSLIDHCQLFPRRDQRRANIMILRIKSSLEEYPSQPLSKTRNVIYDTLSSSVLIRRVSNIKNNKSLYDCKDAIHISCRFGTLMRLRSPSSSKRRGRVSFALVSPQSAGFSVFDT
jgi:hypothetical protein